MLTVTAPVQPAAALFVLEDNPLGIEDYDVALDGTHQARLKKDNFLTGYPEGTFVVSRRAGKDWVADLKNLRAYTDEVFSPSVRSIIGSKAGLPVLSGGMTEIMTTVIYVEKATVADLKNISKQLGVALAPTLDTRMVGVWQGGSVLVLNRKTTKPEILDDYVRVYVLGKSLRQSISYHAELSEHLWQEFDNQYRQVSRHLETYQLLLDQGKSELERYSEVYSEWLRLSQDDGLARFTDWSGPWAQFLKRNLGRVSADWSRLGRAYSGVAATEHRTLLGGGVTVLTGLGSVVMSGFLLYVARLAQLLPTPGDVLAKTIFVLTSLALVYWCFCLLSVWRRS